jgi:undecaprenyl-diphosphatase
LDWNWILSPVYGLISGVTTFLPVSSQAHQSLFSKMTGISGSFHTINLVCRLAAIVALLICFRAHFKRFRRERRIASMPAKRRKRTPDLGTMQDLRFLRMAAILAVPAHLCSGFISFLGSRLWFLAVMLLICGILLYVPQFVRRGNKNSLTVSGLDGLLTGLGCGMGAIPGLSGIGGALSVGLMRGMDGSYCVDMCILTCLPALLALAVLDILGIVMAGVSITLIVAVSYILAAAAAFAGAYLSIIFIRFLAVKIGFSGFAYYCWGVAIFAFILFLMI